MVCEEESAAALSGRSSGAHLPACVSRSQLSGHGAGSDWCMHE